MNVQAQPYRNFLLDTISIFSTEPTHKLKQLLWHFPRQENLQDCKQCNCSTKCEQFCQNGFVFSMWNNCDSVFFNIFWKILQAWYYGGKGYRGKSGKAGKEKRTKPVTIHLFGTRGKFQCMCLQQHPKTSPPTPEV